MAAPGTNRNPLLIAIAVLLIALLGVGAILLQKANKGDTGKIVAAPADAGNGGIVQAPAAATPNQTIQAPAQANPAPVVQQPDAAPPFPADIDDYLKFVKEIERKKQALISKQLGDALLMMTQAKGLSGTIEEKDYTDAFNNMNATMQKNSQDWNNLTRDFSARQPPQACVDLRNKYLNQLGKIQAVTFAVNDAMAHVQSDPSNVLHMLTGMQGKASAEVDSAIEAADGALADVCDKYHLKKDFDIRGDSGSASMFR